MLVARAYVHYGPHLRLDFDLTAELVLNAILEELRLLQNLNRNNVL